MSVSYDEIRVVLDQYLPGSLKEAICDMRTFMNTPIHIMLMIILNSRTSKKFLPHILTKAELTWYPSHKLLSYYQGQYSSLATHYEGGGSTFWLVRIIISETTLHLAHTIILGYIIMKQKFPQKIEKLLAIIELAAML